MAVNDRFVNAAELGLSEIGSGAANRTALQAALDTRRNVLIPEGTFDIGGTLYFYPGQRVQGSGWAYDFSSVGNEGTILRADFDGAPMFSPAEILESSPGNTRAAAFFDLSIDCNNRAIGGIYLFQCTACDLGRVYVFDIPDTTWTDGVATWGTFGIMVRGIAGVSGALFCVLDHCATAGIGTTQVNNAGIVLASTSRLSTGGGADGCNVRSPICSNLARGVDVASANDCLVDAAAIDSCGTGVYNSSLRTQIVNPSLKSCSTGVYNAITTNNPSLWPLLVGLGSTLGTTTMLGGATDKIRFAGGSVEVDVTLFGATGDGTTDDTAAIQAAIDSGATTIRFPEGTYLVTANVPAGTDAFSSGAAAYRCLLVGADDVTLKGDPGASIVVDATDATLTPTRTVVVAAVGRARVVLDGISVLSTVSTKPVAEYFVAAEFHQCSDVWVRGGEFRYCGSGVRFYNSLRCQADRIDSHHHYDTGFNINGDSESCSIVDAKVQASGDGNCSAFNSRSSRIERCYLSRAGQVGVIESTRMGAIIDCLFEGNLNPSWFAEIVVGAGDTYLNVTNTLLENNPNGIGRTYTADGAGTTGYTAATISVDATDDSFNDSGAGFPADLVAGNVIFTDNFANGANNGYFEVVSATTSKIVVTAALTAELAAAGHTVSVPPAHTSGSRSDGGISWTFVEDDVAWLRNGPIVNRAQAITVAHNLIIGAHRGIQARETDTAGVGGVTGYSTIISHNQITWTQQRTAGSAYYAIGLDYGAGRLVDGNEIVGTTTGQENLTVYDIRIYDPAPQNTQGRRDEGLSIINNTFIQKFINSGGSDVWGEAYADRHPAIINTAGDELQKVTIANNTFFGASNVAGTDYLIDLDEVRQLVFTGNKSHEANTDDNGPPRLFTAKVVHGTFTGNMLSGKRAGDPLLNFEDSSQYVNIIGNDLTCGTEVAGNNGGNPIVIGDSCSEFIIQGNQLRGQVLITGGAATPLVNSMIKDNVGFHDNASPTNNVAASADIDTGARYNGAAVSGDSNRWTNF